MAVGTCGAGMPWAEGTFASLRFLQTQLLPGFRHIIEESRQQHAGRDSGSAFWGNNSLPVS